MFTYCFQLIKAMDLNLFFIIWLLIIALIIALRLLSKIEFNYANWTQELFVYGKEKRLHDLETKEQVRSTVVRLLVNLQVPKRWFPHFYCFGFLLQTTVLVVYFTPFTSEVFNSLADLNELIFSSTTLKSIGSISRAQTNLAIVFLNLQITRRYYENLKISTFSNSTIHLVHYLAGYLFYASTCLLQFNLLFRNDLPTVPVNYLSLIIGCLVYLIGFCIQHLTIRQFAGLRSKKKVHTLDEHYIPHGLMFNYVSCPHYFGEILIYFGLCVLTDWYKNIVIIFVWTFLTHLSMAYETHQFYHKKFKSNYPKSRKALIPFLM